MSFWFSSSMRFSAEGASGFSGVGFGVVTKVLRKPAASAARAAKAREQQTRTVAVVLYSAGSKIVWGVALLTAASEFRIDVLPAATLAGLASLALGFGAQNLVRDVITGLYIILEDQFVVGDTIQAGEAS